MTTGRPDSPYCPPAPIYPTGAANVQPHIISISPSRGIIGDTTSFVTLSGQGLSGVTEELNANKDCIIAFHPPNLADATY
jgi:hypothetical protein